MAGWIPSLEKDLSRVSGNGDPQRKVCKTFLLKTGSEQWGGGEASGMTARHMGAKQDRQTPGGQSGLF